MPIYKIGDLVAFTYSGRYSTDVYQTALILHDNWQGNVHALKWDVFLDHEKNYIRAVLNPTFAQEISKKDMRVKQYLAQVGAASATSGLNIAQPHDFYLRFVKNFIRTSDGYRLYKPQGMSQVRVVMRREQFAGQQTSGVFSNYLNKFKHLTGRGS